MIFEASCLLLPLEVLEALQRGFSPSSGPFPSLEASSLPPFAGDGFYCGMALLWLRERMMLDLLCSDYDDLARRLGAGRVCVVFTPAHRERFYDLLVPDEYPLGELALYASTSGAPEAGEGMRAAIRWLKECLGRVGEDRAAIVLIG
ncbi:MAG: hypothetical protein GX493_06670 [Firmicutes bacterium]|nr:hypothetical protein [Bacillota bacterium]